MKLFYLNTLKFLARLLIVLAWVVSPNAVWSFSDKPIHHQLKIELEPLTRFARIEDTVQFKTSSENCESFYLHAGLKLDGVPQGWQVKSSLRPGLNEIEFVKRDSAACPETLTLKYSGVLHDPALDPEDSLGSSGFFFSGESYFYPQIKRQFSRVTFDMQVSLPEPWQAVSQGQRRKLPGVGKIVTWESSHPSEEIYLIGNRFHNYKADHNGLTLHAFLLKEEEGLASEYLETAKRYIDFYSHLIGPYPYEKFALIENSRQTGYGMASFTLMGSRIIRFPFILHSSYPHEILHNWWGNGVFPVLGEGNWSEGLTAYLADHLLMELKGKGALYRFQEMMKFSNYVNQENDFPLSEFSYRDSMASQAIGYAKLLMVFHMLRAEVGGENFLKGLKRFYKTFKYRYAGYGAMQKNFEEVSGQDLGQFFKQWIHRKGAPEIRLKQASYVSSKGRYDLKLRVEQSDPSFELKLPIAIWTDGSSLGEIHILKLDTGLQNFSFQLSDEPVAVQLDPYNDVFRLPGIGEAPASLSKTYGANVVSALLTENEKLDYLRFAKSVAKPQTIFIGDEKAQYPEGSLWVFGQNHPLRKTFIDQLKKLGVDLDEKGVRFSDRSYFWDDHSFVFTLPRTDQKNGTMTWVVAGNAESISGLIRKLPHYGKYGYLVFEGSAPENRYKGTWPSNPMAMQKVFKDGHPLDLPDQKPLVSFKPFPKP
ncbi:MAG: M1 family aminopeptidase [Nitrospinaceae bacterium]|nr:M1 family aminopeptidase [Nitrospinaceae bacterium]